MCLETMEYYKNCIILVCECNKMAVGHIKVFLSSKDLAG